MKRVLLALVIVFSFQSDLFALQSVQIKIPAYSQLQQHGTKVLELDNLEQAYQPMVYTP